MNALEIPERDIMPARPSQLKYARGESPKRIVDEGEFSVAANGVH